MFYIFLLIIYIFSILIYLYILLQNVPKFSCQKFIHIENVQSSNGMYAIQDGEIYLIDRYLHVVHHYDIEQIETAITLFRNKLNEINEAHPGENILQINFRKVQSELEQLEAMLSGLLAYTHERKKRGLINIAGKAMKYIYGVMDSDDRDEIFNRLEEELANNKLVMDEMNHQFIINKRFTSAIENVTKTFQENFKKVSNNILNNLQITKALKNSAKILEFKVQLIEEINDLRWYILALNSYVSDANRGHVNMNMFNSMERDIYNISNNEIQYMSAFLKTFKKSIFLIVGIPVFSQKKYYKIVIEPIPSIRGMEIKIQSKVAITDGEFMYHFEKDLILESKLKLYDDNCIKNLYNQNLSCVYIKNKKTSVDLIHDNLIVTKNFPYTEIIHNCNPLQIGINITTFIQDNNVITFENCSIYIFGKRYTSYMPSYFIKVSPTINIIVEKIHLELDEKHFFSSLNNIDIKFQNVTLNMTEMQDNIKEIHEIHFARQDSMMEKIQWYGILILILLFITIIGTCYCMNKC